MRYMTIIFAALTAFALIGCNPGAAQGETFVGTASQSDDQGSMLEVPDYQDDEDVIDYNGFTVSYNHTTLVPNWVAYELLKEELNVVYDNKSSNFSRDPDLKGRQASREDYSRSGWDKGHMAPKADMRWSSSSYWQSHYFTNICPQNHTFNAGDWNSLEQKVRFWAKKYGKVWVVCGPIFTTNEYGTIGAAKVQIPDEFYKALLIEQDGEYSAIAYVMPNKAKHQPLKNYVCTVNDLEELIDRDLFPKLDDAVEEKVEGEISWEKWK